MGLTSDELLRRLQETAPTNGSPVDKIQHDADLIPDVTPVERSEVDLQIDGLLADVDIIDAYERWCGKMTPKVGRKREGIMISCPNPNHPDKNPSAWINLDKQVWTCGTCGFQGGDMYDIAAWKFGFNVPGYKGDDFPKLRRAMAEDLGLVVRKTLGGQEYIAEPVVEPETESKPESQPEGEESTDNIIPFPSSPILSAFEDALNSPDIYIDWEEIAAPDSFMDRWMRAVTIDDLPHEYYFWLGMQALGFAAGTEQLLYDFQMVKPNLFICLYGRTGSGKSRALGPYVELLHEALPYKEDKLVGSTGTKILSSPGSAEALLRLFVQEVADPTTMKAKLAQVRGMLRVEEFAAFVSRAGRRSNPMKETLIELYDVFGRSIKHTTVSGGTVEVYNPFCQMVTTTQPKAIHDFLRQTDMHSGFLNRWIYATGKRRVKRISYGGATINVSSAATALRDIKVWCDTPRTLELTGSALSTWDRFFQFNIVPLQENSDESMLSRIDLMLKKIILLLCVNEQEPVPTEEIVKKAISLFVYLKKTYMMFTSDIAHTPDEECRSKVIETIKRIQGSGETGATLRQISQFCGNQFGRATLLKVLKTMVDLGELNELVTKNQRGPTTSRYAYVD